MNREEATSLLRDIISVCDSIGEQGIMLMPPNTDDILSHGYQLHIKTVISEPDLNCIKPLVEKHNLAIVNEPNKNLLVIYRPIKN